MAKADRRVRFILPGPLLSLDTHSVRHDSGGTIHSMGGPDMAVIFGPGGPILRGDHPRRDMHWKKLEGLPQLQDTVMM